MAQDDTEYRIAEARECGVGEEQLTSRPWLQ